MQIPADLLAEKNYSGSRLVEIDDPKIIDLKAKLKEIAIKAEPDVKELQEVTQKMDPYLSEIRELEAKKKQIQGQMAPLREKYDKIMAKLEPVENKANLMKEKIQPIVEKFMEGKLGEFERSTQLQEKDGKIFVEVVDEIEEKVKAIRQVKANKKVK